MSTFHTRRLMQVQKEYDTARQAMDYVEQNWWKQNIFQSIERTSLFDVQLAASHLENIYFLRLLQRFESVLREHLAEFHPSIHLPEDARMVWLIDRVAQRQNPPISTILRNRVHDVRRYRNFLTHPGSRTLPVVSFTTALASLNRYAAKLPEPR